MLVRAQPGHPIITIDAVNNYKYRNITHEDQMKKTILATVAAGVALLALAGCQDDAVIASQNISRAADNFEVMRRVVFMNGITDEYMLEVIGLCSLNDRTNSVQVTCKIGNNQFVRHQLGLSDNVTYFAEQLESIDVSVNHYRVTFRPQQIIPDIDLRGSFDDLTTNHSEINKNTGQAE
jgi:hypothetical protein